MSEAQVFDWLRGRFRPVAGAHACAIPRSAGVLLLVVGDARGAEVVLTRRSTELPQHPGQICLPGGRCQASDDGLAGTALREAEEEIGLPRERAEVLGELEPVHLPSGWCVTPVLALCPEPPPLRPCPREVVEIFRVPLSLVLDPGVYGRGSTVIENIKREFYFFEYKQYYVWGATAAMLRSLAVSLGSRE